MPHVLAETDDALVIDKPAGLIVHSDGRTDEPSVADWIVKEYPTLRDVGTTWTSPQGEVIPLPGIVHRLDRTTSGVMVLAKTQEAYKYLKIEFKQRKVEKIYHTFVYGHMESGSGKVVAEIARSTAPSKRWYARPCDESDIRAAITEWRLLKLLQDPETSESASYLEARPLTGRTHQIRVHIASIGHPIVADHLYAPDKQPILGFTRPALHAYSISVVLNGRKETFTASLPIDFSKTLERCS